MDPILPDQDACLYDATLAEKLRRSGAAVETASQICQRIGLLSQKYSSNLIHATLRHSSLKSISKTSLELSNGHKKIKLSYAGVSIEVNEDSYHKLEKLHRNAGSPRAQFLRDAFTLLARYSSG